MDMNQLPALIPTLAARVAELTKQRDELACVLREMLLQFDSRPDDNLYFDALEVLHWADSALSKLKD